MTSVNDLIYVNWLQTSSLYNATSAITVAAAIIVVDIIDVTVIFFVSIAASTYVYT